MAHWLPARSRAPKAALEAAGPGTEVEFVGLIDSISPDVWVVDGQTLAITPETEIKGNFVVGDSVKVHVLVGADGSLTAREIEAAAVGQVGDDGSGDDNSNSNANSNTNVNDDNGGNNNGGGNDNGNTNDNGGGGGGNDNGNTNDNGGGGGGGNDNGGGGNNNNGG